MATKLKNLKIKKVDFVDEGANPDAHRMLSFVGKAAGISQDEIDSTVDEIQKGDSVSFGEQMNEIKNRKITDEIWEMCYALDASLCSILNDNEMDSASAAAAMKAGPVERLPALPKRKRLRRQTWRL